MRSTSPRSERLSEAARHLVIPEGITATLWPQIDVRLEDIGIRFDHWQESATKVATGLTADGQFAATVGGIVWSIPRQVGKALDTATPLLTSNRGWTTMASVSVGDEIFHPSGRRVAVTEVHPVRHERECFEVSTTDGRTVVADAEHLWEVTDKNAERSVGTGRNRVRTFEKKVMTTQAMFDLGVSRYRSGSRTSNTDGKAYATNEYRFVLPEQQSLDLPERDQPIDPYLFGAWLGDGVSKGPRMASGDEDLDHWLESIRAAGFTPTPRKGRTGWDIGITCEPGPGRHGRSFGGALRRLGVHGNKHIPDTYLLGSRAQRLALLQGLLDTDGHVTAKGCVEFVGMNRGLADGVLFLARSLGWRATLTEGRAMLQGRDCGPKYRVMFTPKLTDGPAPFRLARKAARVGATDGGKGRKTVSIKSITRVASRPVRCIKVDSPDGLFLAGRDLVATHNTFTLGSLLVALCLEIPKFRVVWTSHHGRTTTNTFRAMQGFVRRPGMGRFMPPGGGIRTTNGEQEIRFANGSLIMFGAREFGFGRGMDAIDVLVFDESQILGSKALDDMVPATNQARNPHGALLFFVGTPPTPGDDSEVFAGKRSEALEGKTDDAMYLEFSADPDADPDDVEQWRKANPSYPQRTPHKSMLRMRKNLGSDESWLREALGIWQITAKTGAIPMEFFRSCADEASEPAERFALGVEVAPDLAWASVVLAGQRSDQRWHVEIEQDQYTRGQGIAWLEPHVKWLVDNNPQIRSVGVDVAGPVSALLEQHGNGWRFKDSKVRVDAITVKELGAQTATFMGWVVNDQLRYLPATQLDAAAAQVGKRALGDTGMWVFSRKSSVSDITQIQASVLALWAASKAKAMTPQMRQGRTSSGRVGVVL